MTDKVSIKRISEIRNIGTFSECISGQCEFDKLTLVYGLNTYGKSTMCDIFQSLSDNNPNIIKCRETIPKDKTEQRVVISTFNGTKEGTKVIFQNGYWSTTLSDLEVFGSDFIHRNVFTGLEIKHENKENFTSFILGKKGNDLSKKLEEARKNRREKSSNLKTSAPSHVRNKTDDEIRSFIEIDITNQDINSIKKELSEKQAILQKDKNSLQNTNKILNRKSPNIFTVPSFDIFERLKDIKDNLEMAYDDIAKNSKEKFLTHIQGCFNQQNQDKAENWLKEGIEYSNDLKNGNCAFCGQELKSAKELIETYQSYFNEEYKTFESKIKTSINTNYQSINNLSFNKVHDLTNALNILKDYKDDLFIDEDKKQLEILESLKTIIEEQEESLISEKNYILTQIKQLIEIKKKKPYESVEVIQDYTKLKGVLGNYLKSLEQVESDINFFIGRINELKKPYRENTKQSEVVELEKQLKKLELYKFRIEQNEDCVRYKKTLSDIEKLTKKEKELNTKIIDEQSSYLDQYFIKINELFKQFGSRDFTLQKKEGSSNANKKVYSLSVQYKEQQIDNKNLSQVFSESDKRALALAIFFAKIQMKPQEDRNKTIMILDDPITSFDDNRIINTINITKDILRDISQIIILTHYRSYIKKYFEISKTNTPVLYEIEKQETTSTLKKGNKDEFLNSDLEKSFSKINDFIERKKSNESIEKELRKYFENYLKHYFIVDVHGNNLRNLQLEKFFSKLKELGVVNIEHFNKLNDFRESLNPEHHIWSENNEENIRNFAIDIIDFLHKILYRIDDTFQLKKVAL